MKRDDVSFVVEGQPRAMPRSRNARSGHRYTPKWAVDYQNAIGWAYKAAGGLPEPYDGPVLIEMTAYFPIPKSWPIARRTLVGRQKDEFTAYPYVAKGRSDADNLAKMVMDALNGLAYEDDGQVWNLSVSRERDARPRLEVFVMFMDMHVLDAEQGATQ